MTRWWWAMTARLDAVVCWARGHDVRWRVDPGDHWPNVLFDVRDMCPGDIVCETCSESIWCRALDPWRRWEWTK